MYFAVEPTNKVKTVFSFPLLNCTCKQRDNNVVPIPKIRNPMIFFFLSRALKSRTFTL